jgi:DNA polymerase-3 subunit gamma/tau
MSYDVLARKWRPRSFPELVGQEHVRRALVNALDAGRLHHAYLFTGTRGVGKTTIARILAKSLNCEQQGVSSEPCGACSACTEIDAGRFVDLIEVDAASRTRVDETRELLENVPYAPTRGRYKVYLIDEVHMFSQHSFNALLKTLEEPPPHVRFLLATTDPQKVPVTILSRCLQFNLRLMPVPAIVGHLEHILAAEGFEYEAAALGQIARAAAGSMRDALSLLDQAISFGDGSVRAEAVEGMLGTLSRDRLFALVEALAAGDGEALMQEVDTLARQAADLEPVLADLLALLHQLALAQTVPSAVDESVADSDRVRDVAGRLEPADVQLYYQIGTLGRRDLAWAPDPRTGLEMTLLRMLAFRPSRAGEPEAAGQGAASGPHACAARGMQAARDAARAGTGDAGPRGAQVGRASAERAEGPAGGTPASGSLAPPSGEAPAAEREAAGPEPGSTRAGQEARGAGGAAENAAGELSDWEAVTASLGLRGLAAELASNSALLSVEGHRVRLGLAAEHGHLAGERYRQRLEEALGTYLGRSVRVELVDTLPEDAETPAQAENRRAESRREQAQVAIDTDPVVQAFRERFDASVQVDSIEPVAARRNSDNG